MPAKALEASLFRFLEVRGASVTLHQRIMRGDDMLIEAHVKVAFVSNGRARPIPKPLRVAMQADCDRSVG